MKTSLWDRLAFFGLLVAWVIVCATIATLFTGCGPDACQRRGGHWVSYDCGRQLWTVDPDCRDLFLFCDDVAIPWPCQRCKLP